MHKKNVDKDKGGENVPKLESVEIVLVHGNLVKGTHRNTANTEFSSVEV